MESFSIGGCFPHSILDVIVDDIVQFLLSKLIVLSENLVNLVYYLLR